VATEDVAYLMQELGIRTGIDIHRVASVTREVAAHLGKALPGKLYALSAGG
jgi:hydroxymethylglutaryl-CoA lyase